VSGTDETQRQAVVAWLMEGDPAIRWQVMRDLLGRGESSWARERRRVAREGWGRALLAARNPDGHWGRAFYQPKWTSTTYSLQLARDLGMPAGIHAVTSTALRYLDEALDDDGGVNFWRRKRARSETCITGMVLSQLSAFGLGEDPRVDGIVRYLLNAQLPDGGWNCLWPQGATHSSFHTSILVLEGLAAYREAVGASRAVLQAETDGREFFLRHHLYRSCTTGVVVSGEMTRFHFPARWHHDVLRALDYFQGASAPRDERLEDPIALLIKRRERDGRWRLARAYPGAVHFVMEESGAPSRWNTLRALRVLDWWERS
jgi:hypothetical protein